MNTPSPNGSHPPLIEHVEAPTEPPSQHPGIRMSRRTLLGSALVTVGAAAAGFSAGATMPREAAPSSSPADAVVPAFGAHQPGVDTPAQRYATLVAVDLDVRDADALHRFLIDVSATVARITRGEDPPPSRIFPDGADTATDFATGLSPARLTVTVGLGARVFDDYGQLLATAGGSPDPLEHPGHHTHAPGTPAHAHGGHGALDVGLLFCAYGNDPDTQFIAAQRRMAEGDRLNRFIQPTGSALFAILPGFSEHGYVGDTLV